MCAGLLVSRWAGGRGEAGLHCTKHLGRAVAGGCSLWVALMTSLSSADKALGQPSGPLTASHRTPPALNPSQTAGITSDGPCLPPSQEAGPQSPPSPAGVHPHPYPRGGKDSPVQVVEEGEEVEGQLTPGLLLTVAQGVRVHDHGRVVGQFGTVCRTVEVPAGRADTASWALRRARDICRHLGRGLLMTD